MTCDVTTNWFVFVRDTLTLLEKNQQQVVEKRSMVNILCVAQEVSLYRTRYQSAAGVTAVVDASTLAISNRMNCDSTAYRPHGISNSDVTQTIYHDEPISSNSFGKEENRSSDI